MTSGNRGLPLGLSGSLAGDPGAGRTDPRVRQDYAGPGTAVRTTAAPPPDHHSTARTLSP
jgi:hypothetical protein